MYLHFSPEHSDNLAISMGKINVTKFAQPAVSASMHAIKKFKRISMFSHQ